MPEFSRKHPLLILFGLVFSLFSPPLWADKMAPAPGAPNILILMVDTLRADYLGAYGFQGPISPAMDELASESVKFNRCVSPAPWTKPSIASFITGLQPHTHRVTDHLGMHWKNVNEKVKSSVLSDEAITMAEVFHQNGYDTVGLVANDFLIRKFGYNQGYKRYYEPRPHDDVFSATPIFRKTLSLFDKGKIREPFFLYIHLMDVHGPFQCEDGDEFYEISKSPSLGEDYVLNDDERRQIPAELGTRIPWIGSDKARHVKNWRACYGAGIKKFDRRLKPFLDGLKERGLDENTIIILTSDHGEELFDHQGWAHSHTLYNELLNVPLLIRLPKGQGAGTVVNETVSLVDVFPTLVELAGINFKMEMWAGRSLAPALRGETLDQELAYGSATRHKPEIISAQDNRHKLIWDYPSREVQLFDLIKDPLEKTDLSGEKPRVVRRLSKDVSSYLFSLKKQGNLLEQSIVLSDELVEKLRALGYIQ